MKCRARSFERSNQISRIPKQQNIPRAKKEEPKNKNSQFGPPARKGEGPTRKQTYLITHNNHGGNGHRHQQVPAICGLLKSRSRRKSVAKTPFLTHLFRVWTLLATPRGTPIESKGLGRQYILSSFRIYPVLRGSFRRKAPKKEFENFRYRKSCLFFYILITRAYGPSQPLRGLAFIGCANSMLLYIPHAYKISA